MAPAERSFLRPGVEVEVLTRYQGRWVPGFEIASRDDDRYRLRRRSDGSVLPVAFGAGEVRPRYPVQGFSARNTPRS